MIDQFLWRMLCAVHQYNQDMARVVRVPIPLPPQAQITREWTEESTTPSVAYCRWWYALKNEDEEKDSRSWRRHRCSLDR